MSKVPFNVNAYTARLIGRENVSKLDGAILELVKNSYDADASICILYFENSTNTLYIADNGIGMTEDIIIRHWMTIGNSSKVTNYTTHTGRVQTGEKGIGRFALDRISDVCQMLTITKQSKLEWNVNWSDFNRNTTITEIYADLSEVNYSIIDFFEKVKNPALKGFISENFLSTGTIFKLNSLRDEWSDVLVNQLKKNLATLIPPEMEHTFKIYFFCENTTIDEAKINIDDGIFSYDYKIEFSVDLDGNVVTKIYRNEFDFKDKFEKIIHEAGFSDKDKEYFNGKPIIFENRFGEMLPSKNPYLPNTVGKFHGVLYFAKITAPKEEREKYYYKDFSNRKSFMDTFGGIKIYRDNFRVRPYGEPKTSNYDWLLLSNRKAKSPAAVSHPSGAWRVNSDQMLGSIFISRTNITLPDQSNREGIVETKEFGYLKNFILSVIQLFEKDRQYVCRLLDKYHKDTHPIAIFEKEIFEKANIEKKRKTENKSIALIEKPEVIEVSKAKSVIENRDRIIRELEDENRLLRALATTGIVTNTYIHEIKDVTHKLGMKIVMAKEAIELDNNIEDALSYIKAANEIKNFFNSWFKVTIESVRRNKRLMKNVDLKQLLKDLIASWNDVMKNKQIIIKLIIEDIMFKCFPYEIESIFNNLITNSITSFESVVNMEQKEILIRVSPIDQGILIEYEDNGKGLNPVYKKEPYLILEPFETDKSNENGELIGTGMGMWIISKIIEEYNGSIDLSKNLSNERGFHVKIVLKGK